MSEMIALGWKPVSRTGVAAFDGACIDSRRCKRGELFFALPGKNTDGHRWIGDAVRRGAAGYVSRQAAERTDVWGFVVPDPAVALRQAAGLRRSKLGATVVGITGSFGKTTTKELIRAALGGVPATEGNQNNDLGVPLTLLQPTGDASAMVVEIGTNAPGEIRSLTELARPRIAVITGVGDAHLGGFGDRVALMQEKLSLLTGADLEVAVVHESLEADAVRVTSARLLTYGVGKGAAYRLDSVKSNGLDGVSYSCTVGKRTNTGRLRLLLPEAAINAMAALAVADVMGVSIVKAIDRVQSVQPAHGRMEPIRLGDDGVIVHDAYNASPSSYLALLGWCATMRKLGCPPMRYVFGEMRELGAATGSWHERIVRKAVEDSIAADVVWVGEAFARAVKTLGVNAKAVFKNAVEIDDQTLRPVGGQWVIVKGARATGLYDRIEKIGGNR